MEVGEAAEVVVEEVTAEVAVEVRHSFTACLDHLPLR